MTGNPEGQENVVLRVHDACFTSGTLSSLYLFFDHNAKTTLIHSYSRLLVEQYHVQYEDILRRVPYTCIDAYGICYNIFILRQWWQISKKCYGQRGYLAAIFAQR